MSLVSKEDMVDVLRLRYWQHLLNEMLKKKRFKIPIHLAFGHEAAAVGIDRTLESDDVLCLTHRNAAYNLVRAKSFEDVLSHYELRAQSNQAGLMGSMNLAVNGTSIAYSSSILGNDLPVATGIAMNRKLTNRKSVVFVCTGDGAMEEGVFWETLIFARSHSLPLVVVIENDNHSMSSTISQRRSPINLSHVCAGVDVAYQKVNGSSLADVKSALAAARLKAEGGQPACVELQLVTFNQHAGPTPGWPDDPLRIALEDGLVVRNAPEDPVFQIQESLEKFEFARMSSETMKVYGYDVELH